MGEGISAWTANTTNEEGYPGWMPEKQLTYNQEFADKTNEPFVLITKPTAILYINPSENINHLKSVIIQDCRY